MASSAQSLANQKNSLESTGPKTPEGKKRSSLNAMRHGFTGQLLVLPEAEVPIYQAHSAAYHSQFTPEGKIEIDLVQELADLRWSINRIRAHENNIFAIEAVSTEMGLDTGDAAVNSALAIAESLQETMKTLALLSIYEQRKMRAFDKTLASLAKLQEDRKLLVRVDLRKASEYREVFEKRGENRLPKEDGFVCSNEQIDRYLDHEKRSGIVRNFFYDRAEKARDKEREQREEQRQKERREQREEDLREKNNRER